jgi:hypothetical protein
MNPEHKESAEEILMKPYKAGTKPEDIILGGDTVLKIMEGYAQLAVKEAREQDIKEMEALKARYQILRSLDATMKVRGIEEIISIVKSKL